MAPKNLSDAAGATAPVTLGLPHGVPAPAAPGLPHGVPTQVANGLPSAPPPPNEAAREPASTPRPRRGQRYHTRALALQGLYGWLLAGGKAEDIGAQLLTQEQQAKVDSGYFSAVLAGTIAAAAQLRADFAPLLDRPVAGLSPVEHALLLMGAYELRHRPEIPYRVIINEAIELAKTFGGTDGFRYVNGVLDKLAAQVRSVEIASMGANHGRQRS